MGIVKYYEEVNYATDWNQMEKDFDEDGMKELANDNLQAFLNNWQADDEDASDAAVYAALMAADLREWAGAHVEA